MSDHLKVEREGRVAMLTLQRPPVNAINLELMNELAEACRALTDEGEASVVILRSAVEGFFSAGYDLKSETPVPRGVNMPGDAYKLVRDAQWALLDCPIPIIASVGGVTLGLGFMLLGLVDIIVASRSASFGLPEINFGLAGAGHAGRILPEPVRRYMLLSGRRVSADYLAQFGAVSLVVEDDELDGETRKLADEIAGFEPLLVRNMKLSIEQLKDLDVRSVYALEHTWSNLIRHQRQSMGAASPVTDYLGRFKGD